MGCGFGRLDLVFSFVRVYWDPYCAAGADAKRELSASSLREKERARERKERDEGGFFK